MPTPKTMKQPPPLDAQQAFIQFSNTYLLQQSARRYTELCSNDKGRRKLLESLCHKYHSCVRPECIQQRNYEKIGNPPCYAFHSSIPFGTFYPTVHEAHDSLSIVDGWLIILRDASVGIHRPEGRWDDEFLIDGR
ncbi:MAG: hypothetical protein SFY80_16960 [Verrucomicrobiota bacterium]|nr:hypothetical protein [Verrucomicrobiota bacterium]